MVHEMQFPNDAAKTSAPENNNFKEIMTGFKLDYKKEISEMQDKPLTRTEGLILTSISNALHSADPAALQEALSTLDEHPGSVNRVMLRSCVLNN